jgi:hypothetical protein
MALLDIVIPDGDNQNGIVEINTGLSVSPTDILILAVDENIVEIPIVTGSGQSATCYAF